MHLWQASAERRRQPSLLFLQFRQCCHPQTAICLLHLKREKGRSHPHKESAHWPCWLPCIGYGTPLLPAAVPDPVVRSSGPCVSALCLLSLQLVLDSQKRVFSWGFGGYGRLGHAEQKDEMVPRLVKLFDFPGRGATQIYAGYTCSFAVSEVGQCLHPLQLLRFPRLEPARCRVSLLGIAVPTAHSRVRPSLAPSLRCPFEQLSLNLGVL